MSCSSVVFKPQLMDKAELSKWILRQLGAPVWCIELTQEHLDDAIEEALRWFAAKKGAWRLGALAFVAGTPSYQLPAEVELVLRVFFPAPQTDLSLMFSPFLLLDEKVPYDIFAAPQSVGLYSSYVQTIQYIETTKRILNAEPDWEQRDRCLWISPPPKSSGKIIYEYKSSRFQVDQLSEIDNRLIRRYALAWAMMVLGRIRSKFTEFPGAQGSTSLGDGSSLLEDAKEQIEKLEEEIIYSGYPMLPLVG